MCFQCVLTAYLIDNNKTTLTRKVLMSYRNSFLVTEMVITRSVDMRMRGFMRIY